MFPPADTVRVIVIPKPEPSSSSASCSRKATIFRSSSTQTDSWRSNREYSSPWTPVDIFPGKTTAIVWTPSVGELDLRGTVLDAPAPPTELQGEYLGNGMVRLTWVPPSFPLDAETTGIRIYQRDGIFGAYSLVDEVSADITSWEIPVSAKQQSFAFAVTAFAMYTIAPDTVFESPRSSVFELTIPAQP